MKEFERNIEKIKSNYNNLQRGLGSSRRYGEEKELNKKSVEKSINRHKSKAVSKTLDKAMGGMVGELKRTMRDKDLKKDHYQEFKKQNNIK